MHKFKGMNVKTILIIGLVWPEPGSSAAGTRMVQLIKLFLSQGHHVVFASAASKSDFSYNLGAIGAVEQPIKLNDSGFNLFLQKINPDIILFDRFMIEEQYGWRVSQECPGALKLLDTEDLHCLRQARQQALKNDGAVELFSDIAKREIAAILRCDLSLIISETEMTILEQQYKVAPSLCFYLPFLEEPIRHENIQNWRTFEQRKGFVFIGNFLHEPNWNTLQVLKTRIWPALSKKIKGAGMHIYGAYPSPKVMQLHNERERFYVHGRATDARQVISSHRVLLAPIQFGAGVKGKFIDAMQTGTPSVTTAIGAEAMNGSLKWNGAIADDDEVFTEEAVRLYENENLWYEARKSGIAIINERYANKEMAISFLAHLETLARNLKRHRDENFMGQILQYHTTSSTKYLSLWIEEKNRQKQ